MIPLAVATLSTAFTGPDRLTEKSSSGSVTKSPMILTETVFTVSPGANTTSPEAAW